LPVWLSGKIVGCINEVTLRQTGSVLRLVTVLGCIILLFNQATQPGNLYAVDAMSTNEGYSYC